MGLRITRVAATIATCTLLAAVSISGCSGNRVAHYSESDVPDGVDNLEGRWEFVPPSTETSGVALVLDVPGKNGSEFSGVARYGPGRNTVGDVTGTIAGGALWSGGLIVARDGDASQNLQLAGSWDGSSLVLWPQDNPNGTMRLVRTE